MYELSANAIYRDKNQDHPATRIASHNANDDHVGTANAHAGRRNSSSNDARAANGRPYDDGRTGNANAATAVDGYEPRWTNDVLTGTNSATGSVAGNLTNSLKLLSLTVLISFKQD